MDPQNRLARCYPSTSTIRSGRVDARMMLRPFSEPSRRMLNVERIGPMPISLQRVAIATDEFPGVQSPQAGVERRLLDVVEERSRALNLSRSLRTGQPFPRTPYPGEEFLVLYACFRMKWRLLRVQTISASARHPPWAPRTASACIILLKNGAK